MARSLRQFFHEYGSKYLWGLEKKEPVSKIPESKSVYFPEEQQSSGKLTLETMGNTYEQEMMIQKGINKKNKDTFRDGWTVVCKDQEQEPDEKDLLLIDNFNRQSQIKTKLQLVGISADVYGSGFMEIIYEEPETNTIEMPVPTNASPVNLKVLNSEYITEKKRKRGNDSTVYYIFHKYGTHELYMHPNRIIHVVKNKLPRNDFGISRILTAYNTIVAKMNSDKQYGEIVTRFGSGKIDALDKQANPTRKKQLEEGLKTFPDLIYHDDQYEFNMLNPTQIDPTNFHDIYTQNIAAALEMPQYILTGVQIGQVTGSEINLADYYKDVKNDQEGVFSPILINLYSRLLKANKSSFDDYDVQWNEIYIDENAEAEILKLRTEAASLAMNSFVIDENEFRDIMRNGITNLSGESVLEKGKKDEEPEEPPGSPESPKPPEQQNLFKPLTAEHKRHIELTKEILEKEKIRGKIEALEQEKRLNEAKRQKK
jgi:hypothetical protein